MGRFLDYACKVIAVAALTLIAYTYTERRDNGRFEKIEFGGSNNAMLDSRTGSVFVWDENPEHLGVMELRPHGESYWYAIEHRNRFPENKK